MVIVLYSYPIACFDATFHFSRSVDTLFDGISVCTSRTLLDENPYFDARKMPLLVRLSNERGLNVAFVLKLDIRLSETCVCCIPCRSS